MLKVFILHSTFIAMVLSYAYIMPLDKIESCTIPEKEMHEFFDYSNLKIHLENDSHVYLNGSLNIISEIKSPWNMHVHTEKLVRGEWLMQAFTRNYSDFCRDLHDPLLPLYHATKSLKECPLPIGYEAIMDMIRIKFSEQFLCTIPTHYMGLWRIVFHGSQEDKGTFKYDCKRVYAEVFVE